MEIFFLGVGETCDTAHGNSSSIITTSNGIRILLDCGFTVPHQYFRIVEDPSRLDYVWISHFHGDHYLGLPLLFLRLWQMGRTKPLAIVGQKGIEEWVMKLLEMAYPTFSKKIGFPIEFHVVSPKATAHIAGMEWSTVLTQHTQYNLGLLLKDGKKKLYYSGDGRANTRVRRLIQGCDFAIHESFNMVDTYPYHGSITSTLKLADEMEIGQVALVHLEHSLRKNEIDLIKRIVQDRPNTLLPVAGDRLTF
ncbi:MAG: ribonuclease Z [Candidatus Electrothrix sp. AUS1_2]|nr:ribonuclease Z [Candidatus Electrothrix sp. AUS1_2]